MLCTRTSDPGSQYAGFGVHQCRRGLQLPPSLTAQLSLVERFLVTLCRCTYLEAPKEQLVVRSRNQLKAHSRSMLAQSKFGVLQSFLFASAEYALVVCLLSIE